MNNRFINDNLNKIVFSFFSATEIKKCSGVSKNWKAIAEGILEQTKDQVYYIIGNPIQITEVKWYVITFNPHEYKRFKTTISESEIAKSYPKYGKIRLFATEREALDYSLYKREMYYNESLNQSAVFKVHYPHNISYLKYKSAILQIDGDTKHSLRYVYFFETSCKNVIPIEGKLKVESLDSDEVTEYESIDYQTFAKEKNKKGSCTIL